MKPHLHLPIDFELRDDVRTLVSRFRADGLEQSAAAMRACVFSFRAWSDWARTGSDWRPLSRGDGVVDWSRENLAALIEEFCGWDGERGKLVEQFLQVGMLALEHRGDLLGLRLLDFYSYNEHLDPGFRSVQSKGGHAKAEKARLRQAEQMAEQQVRLFENQGALPFGQDQVAPEEQKKAISLIIRIDMACGRSVRSTAEYTEDRNLVRDALMMVRRYTPHEIQAVCTYLTKHRNNPAVEKDASRIVAGFSDLVGKAT